MMYIYIRIFTLCITCILTYRYISYSGIETKRDIYNRVLLLLLVLLLMFGLYRQKNIHFIMAASISMYQQHTYWKVSQPETLTRPPQKVCLAHNENTISAYAKTSTVWKGEPLMHSATRLPACLPAPPNRRKVNIFLSACTFGTSYAGRSVTKARIPLPNVLCALAKAKVPEFTRQQQQTKKEKKKKGSVTRAYVCSEASDAEEVKTHQNCAKGTRSA